MSWANSPLRTMRICFGMYLGQADKNSLEEANERLNGIMLRKGKKLFMTGFIIRRTQCFGKLRERFCMLLRILLQLM